MLNLTISNNLNRYNENFNDNMNLLEAIEKAGFEFAAGSSAMWNGRIVDTRASLAQLNTENPTPEGRTPMVSIIVALKNA